MENSADTANSIRDELPSGGQNRLTGLLNGVGNGTLLVAIGDYIVRHATALATKKPVSEVFGFKSVAAITIGGVVGGLYGIRESQQIHSYREALADKIDELKAENQRDRSKITALYEKVHRLEQHQQAPAAR